MSRKRAVPAKPAPVEHCIERYGKRVVPVDCIRDNMGKGKLTITREYDECQKCKGSGKGAA